MISSGVTSMISTASSSKTIGIAATAARGRRFVKPLVSLPLTIWLRTILSSSSGMIAAAYKKIDSKADSTAKAVENSNSSSPPPRAQGEGG